MSKVVHILDTPEYSEGKQIARSTQFKMLNQMIRMKEVNDALLEEEKKGNIPYFLSQEGNEALHVGVAFGLKAQDWLFPMNTLPTLKGLSLDGGVPELVVVEAASPGASRLVHANGAGWAAKLAGTRTLSCVTFGESLANQDNFHVALNFAGVHDTPVIFVCLVREPYRDTAGESIASRGVAYGIPGVQVSGTDVLAIQKTVATAARRARSGQGPTLIEAICPENEPESPIERLARHLNERPENYWMSEEMLNEEINKALMLQGNGNPKACVFGSEPE